MKGVTLRQLRVFVAVARHLSFARAAEMLSLTPPAVSMQIRELEEQIGLPLFDRDGRKVSLTITGEYFLVHARKILGVLKDAEDMVARFKKVESGRLVIGMVSTAQYFLPPLLARFCDDHPGVEVSLSVANRQSLVEQLRRNEVDLAVMGRPPKEMATRAEPFAAHPHVVVAAPEHPLIKLGHVPPLAIAAYGFIVREPGSGTRAVLEEYFRRHGITPRIAMEMPSNEAIKQAVMANMGISLLSLHTIGLELASRRIAVVDVEETPVFRRWHIVNMLSKVLSPPAEAFRYFMLEHGEQHLADQFGEV
ncbi:MULTISPECIES: LysR family transcriptional regulator [Paraburkholderia]|uniref:LysR family transcriptional regulator n=2 Tax=Paraburkholderia TaxID=1822464 RepID=A0A248VZV6_9BURK|nr:MULTISPECIES: LysR family transcriptional regulator [Paraburkholderia]ASW03920.1 LysR family transcriptional regulator [Paraburkholderia aromaticivorans]PZR41809.1 MAG: LysR family transcriptional regulator [Paraburkholderia fungorum]CAB3740685.1 HTH-type transcriptional activator CmpR [Paraburkholderia phenoliruptrix]